MRSCLRPLDQSCRRLGFSEVALESEPSWNPPLLRECSAAWAEPNVSSSSSSSSLVLEPARSEPVKQGRKRMPRTPGEILAKTHESAGSARDEVLALVPSA